MNSCILISLFISSVQLAEIQKVGFNGFYVQSSDNLNERRFVPKSERYQDLVSQNILSFLNEFEEELADIKSTKIEENRDTMPPKNSSLISIPVFEDNTEVVTGFEVDVSRCLDEFDKDVVSEKSKKIVFEQVLEPEIAIDPVTTELEAINDNSDTENNVITEVQSSFKTFDPLYRRIKSSINTSTFLYHNLKTTPDYIETIRN